MRRPKRPARTDPAALEAAALRYVERYAATRASLRRVLLRRVRRHAPEAVAERTPTIDDLVARFARAGLVDDRAFAEARAASLERAGAPPRLVQRKLAEKGVPAALIEDALAGRGSAAERELAAAIRYAHRRRLGPFARSPAKDPEARRRALAALGRRGFSFEIARRVVDAADPDALLSLVTP